MRAVVQRVTQASVTVDGAIVGEIGPGLCVLLGAGQGDGAEDVQYMVDKITNLRIFADAQDKSRLLTMFANGSSHDPLMAMSSDWKNFGLIVDQAVQFIEAPAGTATK